MNIAVYTRDMYLGLSEASIAKRARQLRETQGDWPKPACHPTDTHLSAQTVTGDAQICKSPAGGRCRPTAVVKTVLGIPVWVGEFTTQLRFPILVVGLADVHWGLTDLDFDPW
eukprot:CAMPEP_0181466776 /NCGR_PEP_ID=MMETSP1110-20121109/36634_1 /TAXON_ID=174948 /ORGANISM="Symbiodinium sp., Strain CCMP421" /LENGTH=112 /DNA_ID=CAMNT_0023591575 /DNA_START=8 /DNA_END=343 /DNA_ORIENTATION=-